LSRPAIGNSGSFHETFRKRPGGRECFPSSLDPAGDAQIALFDRHGRFPRHRFDWYRRPGSAGNCRYVWMPVEDVQRGSCCPPRDTFFHQSGGQSTHRIHEPTGCPRRADDALSGTRAISRPTVSNRAAGVPVATSEVACRIQITYKLLITNDLRYSYFGFQLASSLPLSLVAEDHQGAGVPSFMAGSRS
jgi:hypothetical protein